MLCICLLLIIHNLVKAFVAIVYSVLIMLRKIVSRGAIITAYMAYHNTNAFADSKPVLSYFNIRGFAEMSRIILKVAEVDFVDDRIPFQRPPSPEMQIFNVNKEKGFYDVNMGRVPVLHDCKNGLYIVDKIKIGQSPAIERYLSRKYGLMGNSLEESAVIECVADNINDIKINFRKVRDMPAGEAKDKAMKEWYSVQLPSWAEKLEKSLPSNAGHDFSVGTKLSYADISIWFLFNEFFKAADVEDILKHRSKLFAVVSNVASNTQLQKHLASRPVTMF